MSPDLLKLFQIAHNAKLKFTVNLSSKITEFRVAMESTSTLIGLKALHSPQMDIIILTVAGPHH